MEQHRSVCSLEPVRCEMREFGCSAVVPRKDLATHTRESELQHLTGMAVLNLRLTRQLQQDLAEKDKKIDHLQQEMAEQRQETMRELTELRGQIWQVHNTTQHIEMHSTGRVCSECVLCKVFKVGPYLWCKAHGKTFDSDPFYSHPNGYKFKFTINFCNSDIGACLYLLTGDYDDQLQWPVNVTVRLELLNQAGDHHHVERTMMCNWEKHARGGFGVIHNNLMKYSDLEKRGDGVQYMMDHILKFRLHLTVQVA